MIYAFERLRLDAAESSAAFNDLHELAREHGITLQDSSAFALAQQFLLAIPASWPSPELDLDEDGEVVFDWKGTFGRMMTVMLRDDGQLTYAARLSPMKNSYGTDQFSDAIPNEVLGLVYKVIRQ